MLVDVTVKHLSSLLNYILVIYMYTHFLNVFSCVHLPVFLFSLGFIHPPSFLVDLYVFFTLVALSLACVRHINFIAFHLIILGCFKSIVQTLYIVFLNIIRLDSICIFLIIAFLYCNIVERVSYSQIVKYLLKFL